MNLERTHRRLAGLGCLAVAFAISAAPTVWAQEPAEPEADALRESKPKAAAQTGSDRLTRLLKEASLSPGVSEVARMAQLGTDSSVLTAHVEGLDTLGRLRTEDVAHLQENGVPNAVISAMIKRGAELRSQAASRALPPPSPPAPPSPVAPRVVYVPPFSSPSVAPPSTVTVIGQSDARRGLSFRRYYYSPRSYYASYRATGGRFASYRWGYRSHRHCD